MMLELFDTHTHYNLAPIWENYHALMKQAQTAGLKKTMVVGTNLDTSQKAWQLKQTEPNFFLASSGLHPSYITQALWEQKAPVDEILTLIEAIIALSQKNSWDAYGEFGLDFFQVDKKQPLFASIVHWQSEAVRQQLRQALKNPRPVILHVRDDLCRLEDDFNAYALILKIIAEEKAQALKLIFHCFSGDQAYLQEILKLPSSYISFAGNLTFKNAHHLRECFKLVSPERLLLETDAPYLSPEPKRGQYCQPGFIRWTAVYAQQYLQADLKQIYQNSCYLFL